MQRIYLYTLYERIWHWTQAVTILLLLLTGLEIRLPEWMPLLDFRSAVNVHTVLGFLLVGNAFLGLFYHLATGEIRQFLPEPKDFFSLALAQAKYYLRGIFQSQQHPFERSPSQKLTPLQKITYLGILNILLPMQMITGTLIWGAQRWPGLMDSIGGLPTVARIHTLVAWFFAAFLIMHVYLTTTGPTPLAHIRAMVLGWDSIEEQHA